MHSSDYLFTSEYSFFFGICYDESFVLIFLLLFHPTGMLCFQLDVRLGYIHAGWVEERKGIIKQRQRGGLKAFQTTHPGTLPARKTTILAALCTCNSTYIPLHTVLH